MSLEEAIREHAAAIRYLADTTKSIELAKLAFSKNKALDQEIINRIADTPSEAKNVKLDNLTEVATVKVTENPETGELQAEEVVEKKRKRKAKAEKPEPTPLEQAIDASSEEDNETEDLSAEETEPTESVDFIEEARQLTLKMLIKVDRDKILALLDKYKVKKATQLTPAQAKEFIPQANALLKEVE